MRAIILLILWALGFTGCIYGDGFQEGVVTRHLAFSTIINGSTVEVWDVRGPKFAMAHQTVRITPKGAREPILEVSDSRVYAGMNGMVFSHLVRPERDIELRDVNGNGINELLIQVSSMGAHCCRNYYLVEMSPQPMILLAAYTGNMHIRLEDLDGDGIEEIITADDSFAYAFGSYAESPMPPVVLSYNYRARGYVVASAQFKSYYDSLIAENLAVHAGLSPDDLPLESSRFCAALRLGLPYLYSDRWSEGWSVIQKYAPAENYPEREQEALKILGGSPWFNGRIRSPDQYL